jgi:hypothetical protein
MNADVLLTIVFAVYAVLITVGVGLVIARNGNEPALDDAAEQRSNGRPAHAGGRHAIAVRPGQHGDEAAARWRPRSRLHDPVRDEIDRSRSPKGE